MTTLEKIWDLEYCLSPSHLIELRRSLPEGASLEDYLAALEIAKSESDRALENLMESAMAEAIELGL